ncbi:MAG: cation diffusion facilitator family transporter [Oscillospiraceae bacterium]|nr:cation diffusion facilitator family transporter [Oscillospiraceae bacterium]
MDRGKAQVTEGALSIITNIALFALKLWVGLISGSIALIADAWHTLSDSISSVFVIIAERLAAKKPDKEHPFGHGRWELIAAVIIAFLLAVIGYSFVTASIEKFSGGETTYYGTWAIVATVMSIALKEALSQYAFYLGKKYDNPVITADGWHHRTDSLSSVVVLIGIVVTRFVADLWWMDSVLGIVVALMIFYAAFTIMKDAITRLLGEEPSEEFLERLGKEVGEIYHEDLMLHHVHLHNYITQKELTLHIRLNKSMSIDEGHGVATSIEDMIMQKFDMHSTIHVEPLE